MRLPIRVRLVLGLGAIILLITAGAGYLLLAAREISRSVDEVRRRGDAVRLSLTMAASIREEYAHEAHVILLPEPDVHIEHFGKAARLTEDCLAGLREAARSGPERELVERIAAETERFARLFQEELLPAFRRGERERAMEVHERSELVLEGLMRLNDELSGRYLSMIDEAQHVADRLKARAMGAGAAVLLAAIALAAGIAAYVVRSIHRPIEALARGTRAVAGGDLDAKIALDTEDEFGVLADSFNDMTSRLRANQRDLLRAEKFASLGQLAAGVAHQLNNPLGVIMGYAAVLADPRYDETARRKAIAAIREEAEECRAIVQNLMALARPGSLDVEAIDAASLLASVLEKAERYAKLDKVRVELARGEAAGVDLETDRKKLEQALLNLIVNAAEAMPLGGTLRLCAAARDAGVSITVEDTGVGMGEEDQKRLFDPYFTTKPRGTGLGLAFTYGLVQALGGTIAVKTELGRGTRFEVRLPSRPPAPEASARDPA